MTKIKKTNYHNDQKEYNKSERAVYYNKLHYCRYMFNLE